MIFKATFKIVYFFLAVLGAYYLYSTNFQPTDFFRDTRKVVENNFATVDTEEIKKQAAEKISSIIDNNKDAASAVVEEKIKEAVNEAVEKVKDNINASSTKENKEGEAIKTGSIGKISGCRQGYYFSEVFTSGCVQNDCEKIAGSVLSDQGRCECENGKSGCYRDIAFQDCPGCMYECVGDEGCEK